MYAHPKGLTPPPAKVVVIRQSMRSDGLRTLIAVSPYIPMADLSLDSSPVNEMSTQDGFSANLVSWVML